MEEPELEGKLIRPYTITGGRTGDDLPLIALEALIRATPTAFRLRHQFRWEAARIVDLTRKETALVELAARLDIPVGAVRVLVGDLASRGAVTIIDPPTGIATTLDGYMYTNLLRKVLDGIRSL